MTSLDIGVDLIIYIKLLIDLVSTNPSDLGPHLNGIHSLSSSSSSSSPSLYLHGVLKNGEFCDTEVFKGECPEDQVMMISVARYGRMKVGRCVEFHLGYINCFSDVTPHLDNRCSGRRSCEVRVPDAEFEATRPCLKELKNYLELSFTCLHVTRLVTHSCTRHEANMTSRTGYILPIPPSRDQEECTTHFQPTTFRVIAQQGQHVVLSLYDLSIHERSKRLGKSRWNKESCTEIFGWYKEINSSSSPSTQIASSSLPLSPSSSSLSPSSSSSIDGGMICSSGSRISTVVRTTHHVLLMWFEQRQVEEVWRSEVNVTSQVPFIMRYSVHGCPDIDLRNSFDELSSSSPIPPSSSSPPIPPSSSSSSVYFYEPTSDGEKLKVGCEKGEWRWMLRCSTTSNTWIGQVGNCSKQPVGADNQKTWKTPGEDVMLSYGVAIVAGGILGVVIAFFIIVIISCNRSRRQQPTRSGYKTPSVRLITDYSKISKCSCLMPGSSLCHCIPKTSIDNKTYLDNNASLSSVNFTAVNESKEPLLHDRSTRYADLFPSSQEQVYYGSGQQPHHPRHHPHHHYHHQHHHHLDGLFPDKCSCPSSVSLPASPRPPCRRGGERGGGGGGSMELDVIHRMPKKIHQFDPVVECSESC